MKVVENCDVVISGVGGYFPKSQNMEQLQNHLLNNEVLLETRWKYGERGCTNLIGKIMTEHFDNAYFGIHRQQCTYMDPMQRLVLERTFEALIDAGVNPIEVRGKRIGCYMGSSIGENDNLFLESVVSGFGVTGHSRAMMPNRISYWLNLKGPSVAYDSNWIGGIEVLRLAYESIKSGQCDSCIVGCANLALNSEFQFLYTDMGLLSSDGSNKSYDAEATGYARSDGVVVLYLQRAEDARRNYASVVHVETIFNGNREGKFCDIDVDNMTEFLTDFYKNCNIDPRDVDFVEAYGAAIKDTDKKELEALERVYCKNRKTPLLIGTIKPNTGHSEATSTLFSIVKAIISMETDTIPATLQYTNPNPEIPALVNGTIQVVKENTKWNPKYVAVNGIGINSYYGHVLLKANPKKIKITDSALPKLLLASTRTEDGIKEILEMYKTKENINEEYTNMVQTLFSKPILGHLYRGFYLKGAEECKTELEYHMGNKRQIWFVYAGMGSQWPGMLTDFMELPIFAQTINKLQKILETRGVDLMKIIGSLDKSTYDNVLNSFVGIAAIQIGLTNVLKAVGITPDGIIGHSVGELGCAYADGCMTDEQMILSAYSRGKASTESNLIHGMMAAVGLGYNQIKEKIPPSIEVACHNGPDSSTISGPKEDMEKFVKELQDEGIFARLVNVSNIAYHSRYIKPAAPKLMENLKKILPEPVPRSSKWISTSNTEDQWDTDLAKHSSPEYHTNNLLSSVLFEEGLNHIPKNSILIEIAPHGLLQAILKRSLKPGCTNVPLAHRGSKSGIEFLFTALGKLYLAGVEIEVQNLYPKIEYPVSRGTPSLATLAHWEHSETWRTGLEDKMNSLLYGVRDIQVTLNDEEFRDYVGHQLDNDIVLPCTAYLTIVTNIIASISAGHKEVVFENLHFKKYINIPRMAAVPMHAMVQKGSGNFEILADNDIVVTGKMTFPLSTDKFMLEDTEVEINEEHVQLSGNDIYNEFQHRGHKYSGSFKTIKGLTISEEGSVATVQWNNKWHLFVEAMIQQFLLQAGERNQDMHVPKTIQKISLSQSDLPQEKADLLVHYNYSTGIIATKGIQVIGIKSTPLQRKDAEVSFDSVEFVPFRSNTSKIEFVINTAIHLAIDSFPEDLVSTLLITEIDTENPFTENVKNVLNEYKQLNPNFTKVSQPDEIIVQQAYPSLFIFNDYINEDLAKITLACNGFLIVKANKNILSYSQMIQVGVWNVNGTDYCLLRKVVNIKPTVITIKGDTLSIKDFTRGSVSWVSELSSAISSNAKRIYLMSSILPAEGVVNFVQELRLINNMRNVRCIFNFDKKVSEINQNDEVYNKIFAQDLPLSVFKDNSFGTYLRLPINLKENMSQNLTVVSNVIRNKVINYIGINLLDETIEPEFYKKSKLGNIDYSGVTTSGQKIMGLARIDQDTFKIEPDSTLCWEIPEEWTIQDGATVPHAFACAFYSLIYKAELKSGETVLIQGGYTSVGLAAISIAWTLGCTVYTTVATNAQKAFLKKQFTFLKDHNVLTGNDTTFEPIFMMSTGGQGAQVVLNCLSGPLLQASFACLADYGRFIQYGKFDVEENNSIGMYIFLRNTSFHVVDFNNLLTASDEIKKEIKSMVQDGIKEYSVRPLPRRVVDNQDIISILNNMRNTGNSGKIVIKINNNIELSNFNVVKPSQFICDTKSSYLIYGGNTEMWADLAEWLILRGARRIVISSEAKAQQNHINRRLSLLISYFGADIVFSTNKAHMRDGAAELLSEVYFLGPIHAVFLLPNKNTLSKISDSKAVQYIDHALRTTAPKTLFINFINTAAGFCQSRADAGFNTYNIQWPKDLDFNDALYSLDDILTYRIKNIYIKNDKISDVYQETAQALFKKLDLLLPSKVENLVKLYRKSTKKPELIQLPTLGPRVIRELAPIFVFPGLTGNQEVKDLAMQLLYPTFTAVYPQEYMSIKEMAVVFVEKIKQVWPKGPYTLIGISWGGALTMEVAKLLEKANTHVYMIDASPNTVKSSLKHLGENVNDLEVNMLTRLFKSNDANLIEQFHALTDWNDKLKLCLQNGRVDDEEEVKSALSTLRNHLLDLVKFEPTENCVNGEINLIRPSGSTKHDSCGLLGYCTQNLLIHIMEGDHLSIVKNFETAELINQTFSLV